MVADSRPQPSQPQRSFIARFFIFLFKFILLIAVLVAGGALGALAATWINFSNVTDTAQDRRLDGLQTEIAKQGELSGQIAAMSAESSSMTSQLGSLNEETASLAAELSTLSNQVAAQSALVEAQEAQIATLTEAQTGILDDLANAQTDVENLIETTAGLRRNLTTSAQSSSGVSESVAALEEQVSSLEANLADIEASITSTATVTTTAAVEAEPASPAAAADVGSSVSSADLTLVRLLGYVARAKIHLLEDDTASAGNAIGSALDLVDTLTESAGEGEAEALLPLTENLEAAQSNLDSKPAASAIALDSAWDSLDSLLTGGSN